MEKLDATVCVLLLQMVFVADAMAMVYAIHKTHDIIAVKLFHCSSPLPPKFP